MPSSYFRYMIFFPISADAFGFQFDDKKRNASPSVSAFTVASLSGIRSKDSIIISSFLVANACLC